jgi:hypothetical protein
VDKIIVFNGDNEEDMFSEEEQKYVSEDEVKEYVASGWLNSHKAKGRKMSDNQKKFLSDLRKKDLKGKVGVNARASKGSVVYENEDKTIVEAANALQLSRLLGLSPATISLRLRYPKDGLGYKVYYKNKQ